MKTIMPAWARWLAVAAGTMDTATGLGLLVVPAWTLAGMGIAPPAGEALDYVRFVGVFVGAVGVSYLIAWGRGEARGLRTVFDFTRVFRTGAGVFTGVMVVAAGWPPAWLAVTLTDLGLVVVQTIFLRRYRDE